MHGYPTLQLVGLCDSLVCLYVLKKCCQCSSQNTSNRVKAEPVASVAPVFISLWWAQQWKWRCVDAGLPVVCLQCAHSVPRAGEVSSIFPQSVIYSQPVDTSAHIVSDSGRFAIDIIVNLICPYSKSKCIVYIKNQFICREYWYLNLAIY